MKKIIFAFILGLILSVVGVYAVTTITADQISYDSNTTVKDKIDDLYSNPATKKFCELKSGTALTVGAKYECDPGDGTKRNFFVLRVDANKVKLIMEKNITSDTTMITWNNAMLYFDTGAGSTYRTDWTNIQDIDLPMAQDIANAVNNSTWKAVNKTSSDWFCLGSRSQDYPNSEPYCNKTTNESKAWLFNHLKNCQNYGCTSTDTISETDNTSYVAGYWTRDLISNTTRAWFVSRAGYLGANEVSDSTSRGIRPVITVLKSNLSN